MKKGDPTLGESEKVDMSFGERIVDGFPFSSEFQKAFNSESYKHIVELSAFGVILGDSAGKIVSWNRAMEDLTGIKQSDAVGLNIWDIQYLLSPREFKTPEYFDLLEKRITSIISESTFWKRQVFEQKMTHVNGAELNVEVSTFVTSSTNGNVLVMTHKDLGAQNPSGLSLALQNEALLKLSEFSIELSKFSNRNGIETLITKRIKDFTGAVAVVFSEYNPKDRTLTPKHIEMESKLLDEVVSILDNSMQKIYSPVTDFTYYELTKTNIRTCNYLSEILTAQIPHHVGLSLQSKLGADYFFEASFCVDGHLLGTAILALDNQHLAPPAEILNNFVSLAAATLQRKQVESALLKSEEMLRTITENAADIILELNGNGTIMYASHSFAGYTKEEMIGKNFCDWTATEYHEMMNEALENVIRFTRSQTYQTKALGINNEIRWFLSNLSPVILAGEVKNAVLILTDITDKKIAEEALKESEEKYRIIAQSTIDIIFVTDRFGKQLFLNSAVEKILGYKADELIGKQFADLLTKENTSDYRRYLDEVFTEKKQTSFETQLMHKDGYPIDVEISIKLIKLEGQIVGQGIIRDISAKKRSERELRHSLNRNMALLSANPDMMFVFDANCKIVDFHSESHNQLLIPSELFLGKLVEEVLPHEVVLITRQKVASVLATGQPDYATYELEIDNISKHFESRYVRSGKNEVLSIVRDISDRKKFEESLNIAIESYMDIFNSVAEAIYVLDENGTFIDVNSGTEKMYLYSKDELIGKNLQSIGDQEKNNFKKIYSVLKNVYKSEVSAAFDFWAVRKHGEVFPSEFFVAKGKYFGKDVLIATARDITEKVKHEENIRTKNEELHKINAEKDKFFSIIAHDLRSPFSAFLGLTELMVKDLPNMNLGSILEIAVLMKDSATNLHRLLENLLQWSRLQRGMIPFNPQEISISKVVERIQQPLSESLRNKQIELTINIPAEATVYADENMLESTIRNLFSNAIKFCSKGGKILISGKKLSTGETEISVKDTGIGMAEDIAEKLFRIDQVECRQGTEGEPSTGLGLILCKDFMDKHNGKIWVESIENMGSTFYLSFPPCSPNSDVNI